MTINELREALTGMPGDLPVVVLFQDGSTIEPARLVRGSTLLDPDVVMFDLDGLDGED